MRTQNVHLQQSADRHWVFGVPAVACTADEQTAADLRTRMPQRLRGELRLNEPMSRHVSWRAGGLVDRAYLPADLNDLRAFLRSCEPHEPVYFVGLGSNLLVRDGGLRGTVVFTHWALRDIRVESRVEESGKVRAEAGVASPKVARFAA